MVADDWQQRGLGRRMMARLIEVARERGLGTMVGWILTENAPMLRMTGALGFAIAADPEDSRNRVATLTL